MKLALSLTQRLLLLLFIFIVCYAITALCVKIAGGILSDNLPAYLRISAMLQDVFAFIVPAVATALVVTRRPADLLMIRSRPGITVFMLVVALLFVSIPFQEAVIYWNYHITLPHWAQGFETWARQMENAAFETMKCLLGNTSVVALIVNLLIIGVAAGFSEELLFRGCLQRLLTTGGVNRHVAVWVVAVIFSALHFQLFGFVPRMLLGAYFGYLLIWTGSLWAPVAAHVLNNMMFVLTAWLQVRNGEPVTNEPSLWHPAAIAASAALSAAVLWALWKFGRRNSDKS